MIKKSNFVLKRISTIIEESFPTYHEKFDYIPTFFYSLDKELKGGLNNTYVKILASREYKDKIAFCLNLTTNIAIKQNLPVIIFSLESNAKDLYQKLLSINKDNKNPLYNSMQKIYNAPIYINENTSLNIKDIKRNIDMVKKVHNNVGLIIIDPIYLMEIKVPSTFFKNLKAIAKEEKIPIIITTKLNATDSELEYLNETKLENFDDLKLIYEASDSILYLYTLENENIARISLSKYKKTIKLSFNPNSLAFTDLN